MAGKQKKNYSDRERNEAIGFMRAGMSLEQVRQKTNIPQAILSIWKSLYVESEQAVTEKPNKKRESAGKGVKHMSSVRASILRSVISGIYKDNPLISESELYKAVVLNPSVREFEEIVKETVVAVYLSALRKGIDITKDGWNILHRTMPEKPEPPPKPEKVQHTQSTKSTKTAINPTYEQIIDAIVTMSSELKRNRAENADLITRMNEVSLEYNELLKEVKKLEEENKRLHERIRTSMQQRVNMDMINGQSESSLIGKKGQY